MAPVVPFMRYQVSGERDESFFEAPYFASLVPSSIDEFFDGFAAIFKGFSQ
jgi:hypothetical protein